MDSTRHQSEPGMHRAYAYREELAERIARAIPEDGAVEPLKGLHLNRYSIPTGPLYGVSKPSFCVIAQGSKELLLGDSRYRYDPAHYLLATVELPVVGQVLEASAERPYLSLRLELDPALVGSVMVEAGHLSSGNRGAAQPLIDPHAERSGEEHGDPGHLFQPLAHPLLQPLQRPGAVRFQDDQDVRKHVRHRILGALGAARAAHDLLHLGEPAQDVLHLVVAAVHLVQRGLRRQERLEQQRSLVEPGHEVRADPQGEQQGGESDREGQQTDHPRMPHAEIEHWGIDGFDPADQRYVLLAAR